MTKQQLSATGLRLSKICRALIALGLVKVIILVALAAGYPLPELFFDIKNNNNLFSETQAPTKPTSTAGTNISISSQNNEDNTQNKHVLNDTAKESAPKNTDQLLQAATTKVVPSGEASFGANHAEDPQGSAAARAALALSGITPDTLLNDSLENSVPTQGVSTYQPLPAPAKENTSWWNKMLELKTLPFPRLGLDQAAHAATLDTPPPPTMSTPNSPFIEPEQNMSAPQVLPAGTAGPQVNAGKQNNLMPTADMPTPTVASSLSPDDPSYKEQELARREQEMLVLKKQMEQRLQELQNAERKVQGMLNEAKGLEQEKVSGLTSMYMNMKPKQAARAMETLDEAIAVKILSSMSPKQAGEILSYADPQKVAELTELLSRMRLGQ